MTGVSRLSGQGCDIESEDLAAAATLPHLTELHFDGCTFPHDSLRVLAKFTDTLTSLSLLHCLIAPGACVRDVSLLSSLKTLQLLVRPPLHCETLEGLSEMTTLEDLRFCCSKTSSAGIAPVSKLKRLTRLDLSHCASLECPSFIATLPALTDLSLANCPISPTSLAQLSTLSLEVLDLSDCWTVDTHALASVAKMDGLRGLKLQRVTVDEVGAAHLSMLRQLTSLDVTGCPRIGSAALEHLASLPMLATLSVSKCEQIDDTSMSIIARLPRLRCLDVSFCSHVEAAGLAHLERTRSLTQLDVRWCHGIDDAAVLRLLESLPGLTLLDSAAMHYYRGGS